MNSPVKLWCRHQPAAVVFLFAALLLGVPFFPAASQVSTNILGITPSETVSNTPLTVRVDLRLGSALDKVYFVYRPFGESVYKKLEMDIVGNSATASLPAKELSPPFLEYYLILTYRAGQLETYPLSESADPFSNPPARTLQIAVRAEEQVESQVVFLSPEPTEQLAANDVLISVSLLRAGKDIVKSATRLFLDDIDITDNAVFSSDIIVYAPENFKHDLRPGEHTIFVRLFDRNGKIKQSARSTFTVAGVTDQGNRAAKTFGYGASVQLESRHEQVSDRGTWYNRGSLQLTGRAAEWRLKSNMFVTSDEKAERQPQNRYFIGAESPWLRIGYGDGYPSFPNLILSGKRVRGLHSSLKLNFFNIDLALGSVNRAVDGSLLKVIRADSLAYEQQHDPTGPYGRIDSLYWGKFTYGTYGRDLFAIRPSFGSGETWQLGFTWLKSKDDLASIRYGIRPQENVVVGTDFLSRIDAGRVEVSGQVAFSAYNSDISSGSFTDAYIDTVYKKDAQAIKSARDLLQPYITVNDYLRPLSLKKLATLAYDLSAALDYFDNYVKFTYIFRGSDYNSFGQTFLRKDVQGFNLSDRVRLVENQVLLVGGYERLLDNTSNAKVATTVFSNMNFAVSYYPRIHLPSVTVSFSRYANTNDLSAQGPDSLSVVDDATNRFFIQTSYEVLFGARHTASLSFSTASREDKSLHHYDVKNTTFTLGVVTRYGIPLQTNVELAVNKNTLPSGVVTGGTQSFDYTTLSFGGRYSPLDQTLSFLTAVSPTFGDFKRTALELGTEWYAMTSMSVLVQFSYLRNQGGTNDTIWSLRYRYDL